MKLLKAYTSEERKNAASYSYGSPLMKAIHEKYDCDEVVLPENYTEEEYAELIRKYDVLLTMWSSPHVPNELANNPGNLKYICNITGEMTKWIDAEIINSPYLTVTNWGDAPAFGIAEGAFALLMAVMKDIPLHIRSTHNNNTIHPEGDRQATLYNKRIGIYGMGVIGKKFVEFLKPFQPIIYAFDPFAKDIPEGVTMVDSLDALFDIAQIMVIHAGLTDATRGSVTKELLAKLPDGGIVINTARGQIIDWEAMRQELLSNRLRAGLDVVTAENMPDVDDPVRFLDNVIFTAHHVGSKSWAIDPTELDITSKNCLDNLERYAKGEPLRFIMTPERYSRST